MSWNGDTRTESWQLLAGDQRAARGPVDTVERTGFETEIVTTTGAAYLAVQAIDGDGRPITGGRTEALRVDRPQLVARSYAALHTSRRRWAWRVDR